MERRKFTREFKLEAVRLIKDRGVSYTQASTDLSVHRSQLRNWVKAFAEDPQHAFPGQGHPAVVGFLPTARAVREQFRDCGSVEQRGRRLRSRDGRPRRSRKSRHAGGRLGYLQTGWPLTTAMDFPGGQPFGCGCACCTGGRGVGGLGAATAGGGTDAGR
jgi:transposase-like protein